MQKIRKITLNRLRQAYISQREIADIFAKGVSVTVGPEMFCVSFVLLRINNNFAIQIWDYVSAVLKSCFIAEAKKRHIVSTEFV